MNNTNDTCCSAKRPRLSNIELLRVFAMLLIVCNHYTGHGLHLQDFDFGTPNLYFNWFVRGIGYMGTNLFVLISAYFLSKSRFKTKGLLLLVAQTVFYSVVIYLAACAGENCQFSIKSCILSLFPISTGHYWFVTCYVGLYVLSPFLNLFVSKLIELGQKTFTALIVILLLFFSVIPSLLFFSPWLNWGGSSGIVWFVVIYFVGAYIREYATKEWIESHKKQIVWLSALFCCLPLLSKICIAFSTYFVFGEVIGSSVFYVKNSIILLPASVLTFLLFLSFEIKNERVSNLINWTATGIFSVYLITENNYVRDILWTKVVSIVDVSSSWYFIAMPCMMIAIFVICVLLDLIRKCFFTIVSKTGLPQKIFNPIISKVDSILSFN